MTTRLYWHPIYLEHLTPPGHPERPDRIRALMSELEGPDFYRLDRVEAPHAGEAAILLAHPEEHLEAVRSKIPEPVEDGEASQPIVKLDGDTYVSPKSMDAALTAIGAAMAAVDDVMSGAADNVFVASRPPGHHAERSRAMGFCVFNNIAIAARHAQRHHGLERIAIVDWDVHHGNGTQDIFKDDPGVMFCSTHQSRSIREVVTSTKRAWAISSMRRFRPIRAVASFVRRSIVVFYRPWTISGQI